MKNIWVVWIVTEIGINFLHYFNKNQIFYFRYENIDEIFSILEKNKEKKKEWYEKGAKFWEVAFFN